MPRKKKSKDYSLYIIGAAVLLIAAVGFSNTGQFTFTTMKSNNPYSSSYVSCTDSDNGNIFVAGTITAIDKSGNTITLTESGCVVNRKDPQDTYVNEQRCSLVSNVWKIHSKPTPCPRYSPCSNGACTLNTGTTTWTTTKP